MNPATKEQIEKMIGDHRVFIFMKGEKGAPACTFSHVADAILQHLDVEYESCNVLENPEIRQGIKEYSDWPTIPQLYINGNFVGGSDIMQELYESGELQQMVQ